MAVTGQKVIDIASKYLGCRGTKFWKDYGVAAGTAWCCIFVWDVMRLAGASKLFFDGKPKPTLVLANEYEDNLHEYSRCVYEVQILIPKTN